MVVQRDFMNKKTVLGWYRYAAQRPGFVGHALRLVRERTSQSEEDQRREFGADEEVFLRLQGMPLPRVRSLVSDSNRIAEECGIGDALAFVRAMILAQNLEQSSEEPVTKESYLAAFDEEDDLDEFPEEA